MQIFLAHQPIAKARHRHYLRGDRVITFDPQEKDKLSAHGVLKSQINAKGFNLFQEGPLFMSLTNYVQIPQSWSLKKQIAMEGQECVSRPDLDNYVKFYCDVLNGVAYEDDRQVTRLWAEKLYSSQPRVEITIQPLRGSMINEHAITVKGEITHEKLNYLVKKANKLGLQQRQIMRVYSEEDNEGRHIYFEVEGIKNGLGNSDLDAAR
jgi:Holliday junction resolvase RusA-like endonuclease